MNCIFSHPHLGVWGSLSTHLVLAVGICCSVANQQAWKTECFLFCGLITKEPPDCDLSLKALGGVLSAFRPSQDPLALWQLRVASRSAEIC